MSDSGPADTNTGEGEAILLRKFDNSHERMVAKIKSHIDLCGPSYSNADILKSILLELGITDRKSREYTPVSLFVFWILDELKKSSAPRNMSNKLRLAMLRVLAEETNARESPAATGYTTGTDRNPTNCSQGGKEAAGQTRTTSSVSAKARGKKRHDPRILSTDRFEDVWSKLKAAGWTQTCTQHGSESIILYIKPGGNASTGEGCFSLDALKEYVTKTHGWHARTTRSAASDKIGTEMPVPVSDCNAGKPSNTTFAAGSKTAFVACTKPKSLTSSVVSKKVSAATAASKTETSTGKVANKGTKESDYSVASTTAPVKVAAASAAPETKASTGKPATKGTKKSAPSAASTTASKKVASKKVAAASAASRTKASTCKAASIGTKESDYSSSSTTAYKKVAAAVAAAASKSKASAGKAASIGTKESDYYVASTTTTKKVAAASAAPETKASTGKAATKGTKKSAPSASSTTASEKVASKKVAVAVAAAASKSKASTGKAASIGTKESDYSVASTTTTKKVAAASAALETKASTGKAASIGTKKSAFSSASTTASEKIAAASAAPETKVSTGKAATKGTKDSASSAASTTASKKVSTAASNIKSSVATTSSKVMKATESKIMVVDDPIQPTDEWINVLDKLKDCGLKVRYPKGLSTEYLYILPDCCYENGTEGVDFFTKDSDFMEYCERNYGWDRHGAARKRAEEKKSLEAEKLACKEAETEMYSKIGVRKHMAVKAATGIMEGTVALKYLHSMKYPVHPRIFAFFRRVAAKKNTSFNFGVVTSRSLSKAKPPMIFVEEFRPYTIIQGQDRILSFLASDGEVPRAEGKLYFNLSSNQRKASLPVSGRKASLPVRGRLENIDDPGRHSAKKSRRLTRQSTAGRNEKKQLPIPSEATNISQPSGPAKANAKKRRPSDGAGNTNTEKKARKKKEKKNMKARGDKDLVCDASKGGEETASKNDNNKRKLDNACSATTEETEHGEELVRSVIESSAASEKMDETVHAHEAHGTCGAARRAAMKAEEPKVPEGNNTSIENPRMAEKNSDCPSARQALLLDLVSKVRSKVDQHGFFSGPVDHVDMQCLDYYDVIDKENEAMDLDTIENMIQEGTICTVDAFETNLNRIVSCCRKYNTNPENFVRKEGDKIESLAAPFIALARSEFNMTLANKKADDAIPGTNDSIREDSHLAHDGPPIPPPEQKGPVQGSNMPPSSILPSKSRSDTSANTEMICVDQAKSKDAAPSKDFTDTEGAEPAETKLKAAIEKLECKNRCLKEQNAKLNNLNAMLLKEKDKATGELSEKKNKIDELYRDLSKALEQKVAARREKDSSGLEAHESELKQAAIDKLQCQNKHLMEVNGKLVASNYDLLKEKDEAVKERSEASQKSAAWQTALKADLAIKNNDLVKLRKELNDVVTVSQKQEKELKSKLTASEERLQQCEANAKACLSKALKEQETTKHDLMKDLDEARSDIAKTLSDLSEARSALERAEEEQSALGKTVDEYHALSAELEKVTMQRDRALGSAHAIRTLLNNVVVLPDEKLPCLVESIAYLLPKPDTNAGLQEDVDIDASKLAKDLKDCQKAEGLICNIEEDCPEETFSFLEMIKHLLSSLPRDIDENDAAQLAKELSDKCRAAHLLLGDMVRVWPDEANSTCILRTIAFLLPNKPNFEISVICAAVLCLKKSE